MGSPFVLMAFPPGVSVVFGLVGRFRGCGSAPSTFRLLCFPPVCWWRHLLARRLRCLPVNRFPGLATVVSSSQAPLPGLSHLSALGRWEPARGAHPRAWRAQHRGERRMLLGGRSGLSPLDPRGKDRAVREAGCRGPPAGLEPPAGGPPQGE